MSESLFRAVLSCRDCGEVLNTAEHVPERDKGKVNLTSGLAAGPCPKGCRSSLSGLNLNTELVWSEEVVGAAGLEPATVRLEAGCSVQSELRPEDQPAAGGQQPAGKPDSTTFGGAHGVQGEPATGRSVPHETRAAEFYGLAPWAQRWLREHPEAAAAIREYAPYRGDTIQDIERLVADAEKKPGGQP